MMKQLVYPVITCLGILGCVMFHYSPEALSGEIETFPLHEPIYPVVGENVTYTLDVNAVNGVKKIELFHTVSGIAPDGTVTQGAEAHLKTWNAPITLPVTTHPMQNVYQLNEFIQYRFVVTDNNNLIRSHPVNYAIDPYPPSLPPSQGGSDQPAPVYVQADVGQAVDIIFIPDKDIPDTEQDMDTFRDNCRFMIKDGIFADIFNNDMTRSLLRYFNFYINPLKGEAKPLPTSFPPQYHIPPANWNQLTFAEAHAILHEENFTDFTIGTLFSTEQGNRGTMLHEIGHALFGLADEYVGGKHWKAEILPNNWRKEKNARKDAPKRHKTKHDVEEIIKKYVYKICDIETDSNECQMNASGEKITGYDLPCRDRVKFTIEVNAGIP